MLETLIHEISLAGYKVTSAGGMLDLGTWGSYGIEKLHLTLDAAWQDLTITAFFNVKGEVVAKKVVGKDGYADVPWEATKENTFAGRIVFEGSINGQRRISANLNYKVTNHSEITDSDPVPTDDRWNQFVTENKEYRDGAFEAAERANARAEDAEAASDDAQAAARAAKASENAAKASENAAASSEDNARISAGAAAASKGNAAASADKAKASKTAAAESEKAAAKSAADADSTANSIKDSMTQIAANKEAVSQLKEDLRNENLFVKKSAVIGVRLAANGTIVDGKEYFTSDYIPIERLLNYKKNSPLRNYHHRMCVYNTAKNYIKNIDDKNELYNENGAYVRFCGLLTEIDEAKFIQCNAYDSISRLEIKKSNESYASFKEEVFNNTGYYKKSNDYKVTLNSGWAASGVLLDSEIYNAVEISVKDGEKIAFAGSFGENAVCLEVLYDGALKNRIKISGDFNAPNLFYHKVSTGVTKILLPAELP